MALSRQSIIISADKEKFVWIIQLMNVSQVWRIAIILVACDIMGPVAYASLHKSFTPRPLANERKKQLLACELDCTVLKHYKSETLIDSFT